MRGPDNAKTLRARHLRREGSQAERLLWRALRAKRLGGCKFVRQEPIGPFFVDFVCRARKLVIEIDGATHTTEHELDGDSRREALLRRLGYRVVRAGNIEIYQNLDGVVETILAALEQAVVK